MTGERKSARESKAARQSAAADLKEIEDGQSVDFTAILRRQQTMEYKKLCRELRLPENSAILKAFQPPQAADLSSVISFAEQGVSPHVYDFSDTYLGDRQLRPLAAALAVDRQLSSLRLSGVGCFDKGMCALCEQMKRSPQMELLDISCNRFSEKGAEMLLVLAQSAPRLRSVLASDTVLDAGFCTKRALPSKFAACRNALEATLRPRIAQADAAVEAAIKKEEERRERLAEEARQMAEREDAKLDQTDGTRRRTEGGPGSRSNSRSNSRANSMAFEEETPRKGSKENAEGAAEGSPEKAAMQPTPPSKPKDDRKGFRRQQTGKMPRVVVDEEQNEEQEGVVD